MRAFHTHILPKMDDGSSTKEMSFSMLKKLKEQGVEEVVLTPHYYFDCEPIGGFLERRSSSLEKLGVSYLKDANLPVIYLGAEVAYFPNMSNHKDIESLCIQGTRYILLEMPFGRWQKSYIEEVDKLYINKGIIPIVAHIERYLDYQKGTDYINRLLELNVLVQINCETFKKKIFENKYLKFLKHSDMYLIGTDCHNLEDREPNMNIAMKYLIKNFGESKLNQIDKLGEEVLKTAIRINENPD